MPTLVCRQSNSAAEAVYQYDAGPSLRQLLERNNQPIRIACQGNGACGMCRVKVEGPDPEPLTPAEQFHLSDQEQSTGVRLACQLRPSGDLRVVLLRPALPSAWRPLNRPALRRLDAAGRGPATGTGSCPLGAAIDLGTTHLVVSLVDLRTGQPVAARMGQNPQGCYGADVVTRLVQAATPEIGQALSGCVRRSIAAAFFDLSLREGISPHQIGRIALVGNTAMMTLLVGADHDQLLARGDRLPGLHFAAASAGQWREEWNVSPDAVVLLPPSVGGFVGSDLSAGLLAIDLIDQPGGVLFVDFGTNTEIAWWDGTTPWVTSVPGGSALEASGLRCGLPAGPGAIDRAYAEDGQLRYGVVGGGCPRGVCGTGLVDLIAELVNRDLLLPHGRFVPQVGPNGYRIADGPAALWLTGRDVDLFMQAKAAIGAAIRELLTRSGGGLSAVRSVVVGGVFGSGLNGPNACRIGLLPPVPPAAIRAAGNTALAGAELLVAEVEAASRLQRIQAVTRLVRVDEAARFPDVYLDNLYLRPME